jgi:DNA-binding XRE family transcriptional regulator
VQAGWTQEALAARLGVSARTVQRWENGSVAPHAGMRVSLANALGLTPGELGRLLHAHRRATLGLASVSGSAGSDDAGSGVGAPWGPPWPSAGLAPAAGRLFNENVPQDVAPYPHKLDGAAGHRHAELVRAAAAESMALVAWATGNSSDEAALDELEREIGAVADSYLMSQPLSSLVRAQRLRQRMLPLMQRQQTPRAARRSYLLAACVTTLLSLVSVDLSSFPAAQDHCWAAWTCAQLAEDRTRARGRSWPRARRRTGLGIPRSRRDWLRRAPDRGEWTRVAPPRLAPGEG